MLKTMRLATLTVAGSLATIATAQAMPAPDLALPSSPIVQVRQGCGAGFHRGPYGRCVPNVAPRGPWGPNVCWWERGPRGRLFRVCR